MASVSDRKFLQSQLRTVRAHEAILLTQPTNLEYAFTVSKTLDTEKCFEGSSRLHRLSCGHVIHTHQPTVCGRTCNIPIKNFAPFICILCERWKMVLAKQIKRRSSHIAELILPNFPRIDQTHIPFISRARDCDIVYELANDRVFVPFTPKDIAMVRVLEQRHLIELIFEMVPQAGKELGCSSEAIEAACEYLTICVDNQHLWRKASYEELAAACLYVSLIRVATQLAKNLGSVCGCFGIWACEEVRELIPGLLKLVNSHVARVTLAGFMPIFGRMFPQLAAKVEVFGSMVLRLWTKVQEGAIFPPGFAREHWRRTVASCILAILSMDEKSFCHRKVCAALVTYEYGKKGRDMDDAVELLAHQDQIYSVWEQNL